MYVFGGLVCPFTYKFIWASLSPTHELKFLFCLLQMIILSFVAADSYSHDRTTPSSYDQTDFKADKIHVKDEYSRSKNSDHELRLEGEMGDGETSQHNTTDTESSRTVDPSSVVIKEEVGYDNSDDDLAIIDELSFIPTPQQPSDQLSYMASTSTSDQGLSSQMDPSQVRFFSILCSKAICWSICCSKSDL